MRLIFSVISFCSIFIFIKCHIDSEKKLSHHYQRLASFYCYINDYPVWLEQQSRLNYFLQFAQFFDIDINRIKQDLDRYRLQRQCLRALERLPIIIGSG